VLRSRRSSASTDSARRARASASVRSSRECISLVRASVAFVGQRFTFVTAPVSRPCRSTISAGPNDEHELSRQNRAMSDCPDAPCLLDRRCGIDPETLEAPLGFEPGMEVLQASVGAGFAEHPPRSPRKTAA
jgi:hypothetical protein